MNIAYLVAAIASVFYGGADFYGGLGARRDGALVVTLGAAIAGLPVLALGLLWFGGHPTFSDLAWGAAAGATGGIAAALIFRAIAIGPVSVASPVLALTGMSLPVLVGFALGDRPSPLALFGLALAVLAVPLLAAGSHGEGVASPDPSVGGAWSEGSGPGASDVTIRPGGSAASGLASASIASGPTGAVTQPPRRFLAGVLGASFAAGIAAGAFLVCVGRVRAGSGLAPLVLARLVAIALLIAMLLAGRKPLWPRRDALPAAVGSGVLDSFANAAYLFAVQRGSLSLVAALVSLGPATTVLMARVAFGERWSVPQRWGLACALAAAVCISSG